MGLRSRESLPVAIRVLGATRSDIALTALLPLLRECCGEYLEAAADAASQFGPGAAPRLLSIAIDESLPLSNRMAALDAACEAASGSEHASASLCSDLCRMVRSELERGEWITFSGRQWASAVVESAWGLGGDTGAGMSEDEAIGLGIALEEDSCAEPHWRLSVDHSGAWRTRVAFPARYRSEFNMRSLRASSLARARNSGFDDLDDWSAEFSAPG
jgi:hypothetical protein